MVYTTVTLAWPPRELWSNASQLANGAAPKNYIMKIKTLFAKICFLLCILFVGHAAHAQVATSPCTVISQNLHIGQFDMFTGGQVSVLQTFLVSSGYLFHVPTGFFGGLTYQAVVRFQGAYGIPMTGFVGPLTRAEIQALTCANPPVPPPNPTPVRIINTSPSAGPVGTMVTLTGFGFTADNTVYFAGGAIPHISGSPNSLTFTVPAYVGPYCPPGALCAQYIINVTPGAYTVSVGNENGRSNDASFTVTSGSSSNPLSINGIDGPNSIPIGTPGTWTVHVVASSGQYLHYTVTWGDNTPPPPAVLAAPAQGTTSTSVTLSHSYAQTGTYTPTFTVMDDNGQTATARVTVVVTPQY